MNRIRSSGSLDNCHDDKICVSSGSSSPTSSYTTDEETSPSKPRKLIMWPEHDNNRKNKRNTQSDWDQVMDHNRHIDQQFGHSSQVDNGKMISELLNIDEDTRRRLDCEYHNMGMKRPLAIEAPISPIAMPVRVINPASANLCSRLMECRNLIEAIQFVEQNRDIIDSVTAIIREAPAFRNYDLTNYQTDYSVKKSFNPNFWLDREPIVTTADGNCQYHAVSLSLTGSENYTSEVRLATAVAVIDNREWFDSILKLIDRGSVFELVRTIARSYSWGDETTLKATAIAIKRRIFLYTCNMGKKDYEMVKMLSKEELIDAFKEKKYRGGTGIHAYADPLVHVPANNYIMLFHKSEHFIAVLPTGQNLTMFEPYNPIVPTFS